MKVTVELSDSEVEDICRITGEKKKGPAIRKLVVNALMMKRREEIAGKFIAGELGVELAGFERRRGRETVRWRSGEALEWRE